ncbi:MAG TPA: glycoside hydrolase family 31 protein, partial [Ferruginibacter sp.]|nr:glycoside hydrolase family 31 protein [Ferruginibacter sp.]
QEQVSDAVILTAIHEASPPQRTENGIQITKNGSTVQLQGSQIIYQLVNGRQVTLLKPVNEPNNYGYNFSLTSNERLFGTGERSIPLNRRGYRVPLNNNPWYGYGLNADALNYSIPFVLSDQSYGIFFDNPSLGSLDLGKTEPNQLQYRCMSGEMSFYLIPGKNMPEVLRNYHRLVGTQPLPPRWAMGNFMSRFGYRSEKQTQEILQQMKADSIPVDAIIFDLFWFGDSIKNTLGNLDWINQTAWPNPPKMLQQWKQQNIQSILITEPFVLQSSKNYTAALPFLATDSSGNPYQLTDFYFGLGGIIDIFRKDAGNWFYQAYKKQMNMGVSGWWGDLGEPEKHPASIYHNLKDLGFKRLFAAPEVHNIYGHYWSKMLYE